MINRVEITSATILYNRFRSNEWFTLHHQVIFTRFTRQLINSTQIFPYETGLKKVTWWLIWFYEVKHVNIDCFSCPNFVKNPVLLVFKTFIIWRRRKLNEKLRKILYEMSESDWLVSLVLCAVWPSSSCTSDDEVKRL